MTTVEIPMSALSAADHRAHLRRAMIASTVGTTIEWYDFLLYGQVTALVFGKLFFPKSDPLVGVLEAFAGLFIGFVADHIAEPNAQELELAPRRLELARVGAAPNHDRGACGHALVALR
jgi:hypothetical protein